MPQEGISKTTLQTPGQEAGTAWIYDIPCDGPASAKMESWNGLVKMTLNNGWWHYSILLLLMLFLHQEQNEMK